MLKLGVGAWRGVDATLGVLFLNRMTELGGPESIAISR